jgi:signal transduction histidine kinase
LVYILYQLKTKITYLLILLSTVFAVAQNLQFKNISVNDGLNANSVNDIIKDKHGFLWLATSDGICRYDGRTFKQYRYDKNKPNSLASYVYIRLFEDNNGNIWMNGDNGIEVIEAKTGMVKMILPIKNVENENLLYYFCKTNIKNTILLVTPKIEINYIDIDKLKIVDKIKIENKQVNNQYIFNNFQISDLYLSDLGNKSNFINFKNGEKITLNIKEKTFERKKFYPNFEKQILSGIHVVDSNNICFIAKDDDGQCLYYMNHKTNIITKKITIKKEFKSNYILGFDNIQIDSGKILIGLFNSGLYVYDTAFHLINTYKYEPSNPNSLAGNLYFSSIKRLDNILWVATNPSGVSYSNIKGNLFYTYKSTLGIPDLSKGIFTDRKGNVYNMPVGIGMKYYDKNTGLNITTTLPKNVLNFFKSVNYGPFNSTLPLNKDEVLIYTPTNLFIYNHSKFKFINYQPFINRLINNIKEFHYRQAYVLGNRKILLELDKDLYELLLNENGTVQILNKTHFAFPITSILQTQNGNQFIGTFNGIYFQNKSSNSIQHIPESSNMLVKCLTESKTNMIYAATLGGLMEIKVNGELKKHYSTANGLTNNFCYGILEDTFGHIWVSNNMGLNRLNPKENTFSYYTIADGLQGNEFNSNAYYKDDVGNLYFGGIYGVSVTNPALILKNKRLPKPMLTAMAINDTWINKDTAIWTIPLWDLDHTQNSLTFEFSSMILNNEFGIQYYYKLEGYDKTWINSEGNTKIRYPELPPGTFQFFVKTKKNEQESELAKLVTINIRPAFYQTYWFYMFCILAAGAIFWRIFQYFSRKKIQKQLDELKNQQQLESERRRISRDLHDNMGAYTSALLSNVQSLKSKFGENADTQKMQVNAQSILSSLRETIWVLNNKEVTLMEFNDGFKNYCFKILKNFENINFEADENITKNPLLTASKAIHLNKIMQEIIQNIVKHADATLIEYTIIDNENNIEIKIKDNGKGYNHTKISAGNGLENIHWRAKEAELKIEMKSEIGKGTSILINTL